MELLNFEEFAKSAKNKIFRYWRYKRPGLKYVDDEYKATSEFVNDICSYGFIESVTLLPDNDILIGFRDPDSTVKMISYEKLSGISLGYVESDDDEYISQDH